MSHRISARIRRLFIFQALFFCVLFTGFVLSYAFVVEDNIFNLQLDSEAAHIQAHFKKHGVLAEPRFPFMRLYHDWHDLPEAAYRLHVLEPQRVEFSLPGGEVIHAKAVHLAPHQQFILVAHVRPFEFANRTWPSMLKLLLLFSALCVFMTSSLAYWRVKKTLAPLDRLTRQLGQPHAGGLAPHFAAGFPKNEIGYLARVIEQQWQQLQSSLARERQFTRDVSHELRTPMTILWNIHQQLVAHAAIRPDQLSQFGDMLARQQATVDILLALARQESLDREQINLVAAVEQSILMHPLMASRDDFALKIDIAPEFRLACNARLLELLLANLLDNALKYSTEPALSIYLGGHCLYYVNAARCASADDVPAARIESQWSAGIGQGLSLATRICVAHGWEVRAGSRQDGQFVVAITFQVQGDAPVGDIGSAA